jgi:hypothetical protein
MPAGYGMLQTGYSPLLGTLGQQPAPPAPQMMPASVGDFHIQRPQQPSSNSSSLGNMVNPISALFATPSASLGAMAGTGAEVGGTAGAMTAAPEAAALGGEAAVGGDALLGTLGGSDMAALLPLLLL